MNQEWPGIWWQTAAYSPNSQSGSSDAPAARRRGTATGTPAYTASAALATASQWSTTQDATRSRPRTTAASTLARTRQAYVSRGGPGDAPEVPPPRAVRGARAHVLLRRP